MLLTKKFVRVRSERELCRPTRTADLHEVPRHLTEPSVSSGQRIDVMSCMQYKLSIFFEEENWVPVNFRGAIVARRFRNMASFVLLL